MLFGLALAAMNTTFYASLAYLPIGVAVTIEFLGPLTLAAVLSRRPRDLLAVAGRRARGRACLGSLRQRVGPLRQGRHRLRRDRRCDVGGLHRAEPAHGSSLPGLDGLALALVVSTVAVAPLGLTTVDRWTWQDVGLGLGIAVLSSVLPYSLELVALRHLAQRVFGVLLSLEPAVAALAGFIVLSQVLDAAQIAGMALVVAASAIVLGSQRGGQGGAGRAATAAGPTAPDPTIAAGDESEMSPTVTWQLSSDASA